MDLSHPAHPNNKPGLLVKAIKMMQKKPLPARAHGKRKHLAAAQDHVLPNIAPTRPGLPRGSYAK